jgi:hypothetical protein
MKVVIRDIERFESAVFGADCFIKNFPELQTTGVEIKRLFKDELWYVINPETGWYYDVSTFFTKDELKFLKQVRTEK